MSKRNKIRGETEEVLLKQNIALIAAEEFALSMVPLLIVVNEAGGVAAAISILKAAKKK